METKFKVAMDKLMIEYEVVYIDQNLLHQWRKVNSWQWGKKMAKKLKGTLIRRVYNTEGVCVKSSIMADFRN